MTGIWLLLWIVFVFFSFGYGIGRDVGQATLRRGRSLPFNAKIGLFFTILMLWFTLDQAKHAGWIPKTAALHIVLSVGGGILGIICFVVLIVLIFGLWIVPAWQRLRKQRD